MADSVDWINFYELLKVDPEASLKQISKQYRIQSLVAHPDKQGGSTELFHKLKHAYDILRDPSTRGAYDDTYKATMARKVRNAAMDSKRKADREILESRELAAKKSKTVDREDAIKMSLETARLREEGYRHLRQAEKDGQVKADVLIRNAMDTPTGSEATILVKWRGTISYNEEFLKRVFSRYGTVDSLMLKEAKRKGSAVISFTSILAANAAIYTKGDKNKEGFTISWASGEKPVHLDALLNKKTAAHPVSSFTNMKPTGMSEEDYEEWTLNNLIQMKSR